MLLIVAEAELAQAVAGAGILGQHGFEVGDGFLHLAGVALHEGAIVERARIAGQQSERLGQVGFGVVVFFPGDFNDGHVGVGVGVVGAQGGDALKGMDGGLVLLRVEQADAVVIPAHPCLVFAGIGRLTGAFSPILKVLVSDAMSMTGMG